MTLSRSSPLSAPVGQLGALVRRRVVNPTVTGYDEAWAKAEAAERAFYDAAAAELEAAAKAKR